MSEHRFIAGARWIRKWLGQSLAKLRLFLLPGLRPSDAPMADDPGHRRAVTWSSMAGRRWPGSAPATDFKRQGDGLGRPSSQSVGEPPQTVEHQAVHGVIKAAAFHRHIGRLFEKLA